MSMVTPVLIWYGLTYSVLLGWHHLLQNQISTVRTSFFKKRTLKIISMEKEKQNNQRQYTTIYSLGKYYETLICFLKMDSSLRKIVNYAV